ncbi:carbohydrate ABC transporter permease [Paenibacillus eucommiae]|uniref:ABC-type glycerol-3-phosphate transport system permease component n=1 Tax=Paenibacillus eucommiae TaxID=1355755 RepID=A0ABS4J588_9BACL|nr:carbohydrate ABC transporter permease [Paenibacillus eucommiae]MBP1994426.1 ABC-type glycerol-3-phosphate transport system permease component [Paenibacillus eucommiae]
MNFDSGRRLRFVSFWLTAVFSIIIIFPFLFMISNSLKDDSIIYDSIPTIIPRSAISTSVALDYSGSGKSGQELLEQMMKDSTMVLYSIPYERNTDPIYEVKMYGVMDGKTIFYTRAHKAQMRLELDFGIFKASNVNKNVILKNDRYKKSAEKLCYKYDPSGLKMEIPSGSASGHDDEIKSFLIEKYGVEGAVSSITSKTNFFLMLENFKYYVKLPVYMYPQNETIQKYSFFTFIGNTFLVIGWAIVMETIICSITAYGLSRLFKKRVANLLMLFFLATMMVPSISILIPQFMMFKSLGLYNNYWAMLLPFLYPFPYYILLFKGFFDQLPGEIFEAARIDGASEWYNYSRICLQLSKPIIALIALNLFLSNWNDFFWFWMVTEDQKLWTLNVALYNLSKNAMIKPNFMMGLSIITIVPVIFLTMLFSEQIKSSIASSGVKG